MPLISQQFPSHEHSQADQDSARGSLVSSLQGRYESDYSNMEKNDSDKEMDNASAYNEIELKKGGGRVSPAIPQRSELRASRIMDSILQLNSMEKASMDELKDIPDVSDPHELYLSSEEDASETADDYDESIIELDMDSDHSRPSTSNSHEITARAVSFVYVGKPNLIDIFSNDISITSPSVTSDDDHKSLRRPATSRTNSSSNTSFRPSTSRSSSLAAKPNFTEQPQPQSQSFPTLKKLNTKSSRPSFLDTDPFPAAEASEMDFPASPMKSSDLPPRTPTSIANAALKNSFMRVSQGINMTSRKKPSMSKISTLQFMNVAARSSTSSLPPQNDISSPAAVSPQPLLSERGRTASMNNLSLKMASRASQEQQQQMPVMQEEGDDEVVRERGREPERRRVRGSEPAFGHQVTIVGGPPPSSPMLPKLRASVLALGRKKSTKTVLI